ncbi:TerD-family protein [Streptomyces spiroverticillatus]|uniref:TerD-family protein n=1 Tax=Streptomyces finlayi TaxID=67296 RepID=A0A918WVL4_9ACTN|nr:TerD family protein [Streptomyces finlayi]GHA04287.1 TerD-family protein [Streptomyces spiroverticillatus]GHC88345.1 TerD-family protein [Streptomyces finlayi]
MSSFNKGIRKAEVALKWDPNPLGAPAADLDIVAAVYRTESLYEDPAYLVHFGSRSPDGTITLHRDSKTGQGFGADEQMTIELERLSPEYGRVVLGVAIQQRDRRMEFGDIQSTSMRVTEGYTELLTSDFVTVARATAATVAEFVREADGSWDMHETVRGFDAEPEEFTRLMGVRQR